MLNLKFMLSNTQRSLTWLSCKGLYVLICPGKSCFILVLAPFINNILFYFQKCTDLKAKFYKLPSF